MRKFLIFAFILASVSVSYSMSIETTAGKVEPYASIRGYTFYQRVYGSDSFRDIYEVKSGIYSNSRFGVKWEKDDLYAQFEMGASDTDVSLRLFYGGYKTEYGTFEVGQFSSISDTLALHSRVFDTNTGLVGFGALGLTRRAGLGYHFSDLSIQITSLDQDKTNFTGRISTTKYEDIRFMQRIPKIELAYTVEAINLKIFGAYAMFAADAVDKVTKDEKEFDGSAYHVGLAIRPKIGAVTLKASGFYAVNAGLYAAVKTGNGKGGRTNLLPVMDANSDLEDVSTYGGAFSINYKVNPKLSIETGIGYQSSTSDPWKKDDINLGAYLNAPYKVSSGFTIIPEFGYLDHMKRSDGTKDAKVIQIGTGVRIDL